MWVADMDFRSPPAVVEAIVNRAKQGIYGYTIRTPGYYDAIISWQQRRHNWQVEQEWLSSCPGIVAALSIIVSVFTQPGDKVLLQSPVYTPFYKVISENGREIVNNELVLRDGKYRIDFDRLEEQLRSGVKLMLLCSPHNPVGRVWQRDELMRLGELCLNYNTLVVSDEIHCDLVYPGQRHIPFASLSEEFAQNSITCIAPSKTFNLAGLQTSVIILPNRELRNRYNRALKARGLYPENFFGVTAVEAAYNHGEEWLEQLLRYLQGNLDFLTSYIAEHISEIKVIKPEGTYLVWLHCRALGMDANRIKQWMYHEAKVALIEGSSFGKNGEGFLRMNIACPRSVLAEALARIRQAAEKVR
jgi:cystathionine beta-lyase